MEWSKELTTRSPSLWSAKTHRPSPSLVNFPWSTSYRPRCFEYSLVYWDGYLVVHLAALCCWCFLVCFLLVIAWSFVFPDRPPGHCHMLSIYSHHFLFLWRGGRRRHPLCFIYLWCIVSCFSAEEHSRWNHCRCCLCCLDSKLHRIRLGYPWFFIMLLKSYLYFQIF